MFRFPAKLATMLLISLTAIPLSTASADDAFPFHPGERFDFSIRYGVIRAGTATMQCRQGQNGEWIFSTLAQSNDFFDAFFKVRDAVQSWVDPTDLRTLRFSKRLREGSFQRDEFHHYDWNRNMVRYNSGNEYPVEPDFRDVLTTFHFLRTVPLSPGALIPITYHSSKKNWPVHVRVHGIETVSTPAGKFRCYKVEPNLKTVGVFKQTGRLLVWITADERRMPVKLESKVTFGAFKAVLTNHRS